MKKKLSVFFINGNNGLGNLWRKSVPFCGNTIYNKRIPRSLFLITFSIHPKHTDLCGCPFTFSRNPRARASSVFARRYLVLCFFSSPSSLVLFFCAILQLRQAKAQTRSNTTTSYWAAHSTARADPRLVRSYLAVSNWFFLCDGWHLAPWISEQESRGRA